MSIQTITSPSGETLVVLSESEYQKLVDSADIATATRVRHLIETGEDELVPSQVVKRLVDGQNPVRVWREHRGLSVRNLAAMAEISPAYLSEIETGKKEGRIGVLARVAKALGITLDDLV